ncbi:MAG: histidine--tRNA ligase [Deltaproteobacteria bacterium]|nr:MAG: histidine--tRNA ligase [Deltaproteobacteria bacterium]
MAITAIKGMSDIYSPEVEVWQQIEEKARQLFARFGFRELRTPILEKTELFARSIGEDTDIVQKEMYTFPDRKGNMLTLRPEATASIVRAIIQHRLYNVPTMGKFFAIGPMFRYERPQKGRYRQFHQVDAEVVGSKEPVVDAEVMYWAMLFLEEIGIRDSELHINSLGCPECRSPFRERLVKYLREYEESFCKDCGRRIYTNPLRVFDCKVEKCKEIVKGAPKVLDSLCGECKKHFEKVLFFLDKTRCTYKLNHHLVRGLDYYNRTAFEIIASGLGAQNAVGGGGRYDGLFKELGGPDIPAVGFALGIERLLIVLKESSPQLKIGVPDLYMIALGEKAQEVCFSIAQGLRKKEIYVEMGYELKSLKSQMRRADKFGAVHVLIIGENELEKGIAILRNMVTKKQSEIALDEVENILVERIKKESE